MDPRLRGLALVAFPALLGSCNATANGFAAVSVTPIYGWADGCNAVAVRGHGFGDDVSVTIGGAALASPTLPDAGTSERGFQVYGTVPAGTAGNADVVVTSGGETSTITGGYRYVACPRDFLPESVTPESDDGSVASGTVVDVTGCALGGATKVKIGDADPVDLTLACGTATATFTAPANADGTYDVLFLDASDNIVFPQPYPCPADDDTADTAVPACDTPFTVTYGGAP